MPQEEMRKKTRTFKHVKTIPFKNRAEVMKFLEKKFGHVSSPFLDSERTILYYGVADERTKYGWRHVATYEARTGKLRY